MDPCVPHVPCVYNYPWWLRAPGATSPTPDPSRLTAFLALLLSGFSI